VFDINYSLLLIFGDKSIKRINQYQI